MNKEKSTVWNPHAYPVTPLEQAVKEKYLRPSEKEKKTFESENYNRVKVRDDIKVVKCASDGKFALIKYRIAK